MFSLTLLRQVSLSIESTILNIFKTFLVHIESAIRDQSMIWKILDEASAESNIDKILNEALAELNISKMTRHTRLERNSNNIVRGFSRVQYCWYDF